MINENGFFAYLHTSLLASELRILPNWLLYERLCYLYSLTDDHKNKEHIESICRHILGYYFDFEKEFTNQENESHNKYENNEIENFCFYGDEKNKEIKDEHRDNDNICFLTTVPGIHGKKWQFIIGDLDFYPSVPHGHLEQKRFVKLDAYRGNTYDTTDGKNKELKRETKYFITNLWNNKKFRCFALDTINNFININYNFNWYSHRKIKNPYKLPK